MTSSPQPLGDASAALVAAAQLRSDGRPLEALRLVAGANRLQPDSRLEVQLVELRHDAFAALDRRPPASFVPVTAAPVDGPLSELQAHQLTPASLRAGFARHGCVLVRNLISTDRAAELAAGIDQALAAFDAGVDGAPPGDTAPWYAPFTPGAGEYRVGGRRKWMRASGGMWTVDSPHMLAEVCDVVERTGVGQVLTDYLGERPALSANKCNLRRVPVTTATNWHQDGAFLGPRVQSANLWLALSACGTDSPGLDVVPRRLDEVLETGTRGAIFDWSVSPEIVAEVGTPVLRPSFGPGDALIFDHLFLHRTGVDPGMTRERYAIETWFFAPSSYPDGQIPVVY